MTRRRALMIVLVGCCVLLGVKTIQSAAPAVAASTAPSKTAPRDLTEHFPLGPQRLCCQSASHSQTSTPPARSGARGSSGAHHASSSGMVAAVWILLGAVATALLAAGIATSRRRRRGSTPVLSAGVPTAGHVASARPRPAADPVSPAPRKRADAEFLVRRRRERRATGTDAANVPAGHVGARAGSAQTRAAPAPGVDSGTDSVPRPHNETAALAFRAPVIPMDSEIAPMAADAFSRMAYDGDNRIHPKDEPRAEE